MTVKNNTKEVVYLGISVGEYEAFLFGREPEGEALARRRRDRPGHRPLQHIITELFWVVTYFVFLPFPVAVEDTSQLSTRPCRVVREIAKFDVFFSEGLLCLFFCLFSMYFFFPCLASVVVRSSSWTRRRQRMCNVYVGSGMMKLER